MTGGVAGRGSTARLVMLAVVGVLAAIALPLGLRALVAMDAQSPDPGGGGRGDLAIDGLRTGNAPRDGYLRGREFVHDGRRTALGLPAPSRVQSLVVLRDGFLVAAEDAEQRAFLLSAGGEQLRTWPLSGDGRLAVSPDGGAAALVAASVVDGDEVGAPIVVREGRVIELPTIAAGAPYDALAVGDCRTPSMCTVIAHAMGDGGHLNSRTETWRASRQGAVPASLGIRDVSSVAADGHVAGTTKVINDGDGACSGVAAPTRRLLWSTCEDDLLAFSPDSSKVLGTYFATVGFGDRQLTVFEARTGRRLLHLRTAPSTGILQMGWEDDGHLLAVLASWTEDPETGETHGHRYAVLRIGVDGSRELAVPPMPGAAEHRSPLVLPAPPTW